MWKDTDETSPRRNPRNRSVKAKKICKRTRNLLQKAADDDAGKCEETHLVMMNTKYLLVILAYARSKRTVKRPGQKHFMLPSGRGHLSGFQGSYLLIKSLKLDVTVFRCLNLGAWIEAAHQPEITELTWWIFFFSSIACRNRITRTEKMLLKFIIFY